MNPLVCVTPQLMGGQTENSEQPQLVACKQRKLPQPVDASDSERLCSQAQLLSPLAPQLLSSAALSSCAPSHSFSVAGWWV
mmetsp:Transcript_24449/g.38453  ORF Transcript_24449/g.38453 Transcript_24449/m.38453 type:complete len:81 (+) Transcript_24449:307-549(+)